MGKDCKHTGVFLEREGTDQLQRYLKMLQPKNVSLIDLSTEDWMQFAYAFAAHVNFINTESNVATGNWQNFFLEDEEIQELLNKQAENGEVPAHLALYLCFLKLLQHSQDRFNQITERHLDFYYKKVLHLDKDEALEDQVHVIFKVAKNALEARVAEGTELDGGKDGDGKKRTYATNRELIANKANVVSIQNVFNDQQGCLKDEEKGIKYSTMANSLDGFEEDFKEGEHHWWPFGNPYRADAPETDRRPFAKLGFAIASPILNLREGERTITFTCKLSGRPSQGSFDINNLPKALKILFSTEKEWAEANLVLSQCQVQRNLLKIVVRLDEGKDPVVPYNRATLLEHFATTNPVARFVFVNEEGNYGYLLYDFLKKRKLKDVTIDVNVKGIQEVLVENDLGRLDASKPFLPFGPQPIDRGNFYIGCQEPLSKEWKKITIRVQWKDTPENFVDHYFGYRNNYRNNLARNTYTLDTENYDEIGLDGGVIINTEESFKADIDILKDRDWKPAETETTLFQDRNDDGHTSQFELNSGGTSSFGKAKPGYGVFNKKIGNMMVVHQMERYLGLKVNQNFQVVDSVISGLEQDNAPNFSSSKKQGFIRLSLRQSFLHELFPTIFAVAMGKQNYYEYEGAKFVSKSAYIPKEPYTPTIQKLEIDYTASTSKSIDISGNEPKKLLNDYLDEGIEFFHEHPFGQSEEHRYLKMLHDFSKNEVIYLTPSYTGSHLYIGLEGVVPTQQLSLLIQVLEGTENPLLEGTNIYQKGEYLQWQILTDNQWQPLNDAFLLEDQTDNFLKSGLVVMNIPKEANNTNSLMPEGFHWLRVRHTKRFDTVSKLIDIMAQASIATFKNNENELSHIQTGLPAKSIAKLIDRPALLKGVEQPFSSFGGRPEESNTAFYRRVSERLRHKARAITIWDYEHLVLQEFSYLYKAKCLSHTKGNNFLAPGEVELVVVPNVVDQNTYDIYQPRISLAKRNEIASFINKRNTLHVCTVVDNPIYHQARVSLYVRFYEGMDINFYKKVLQQDLAKYFAPWAFSDTAEILFGRAYHESVLIHYIENLSYVDYLKNLEVEFFIDELIGDCLGTKNTSTQDSSPRVILTSVKPELHIVAPIETEECTTIDLVTC